jgi:SSS family solute:Na+ symporter
MWAVVIVPIALAFVESTGSILETMASVLSYLVGAKFAMFGMGFFSKHVSERGLIIGVIAGCVAVYISARGLSVLGIEDPNIAWPWYAVIGSVVNIATAWIASITLDGFKTEWHRYSVPGQQMMFAEEKKAITEDGWYLVPGRIEKPVWGLLGMFALIIIFMMWFGTLAP